MTSTGYGLSTVQHIQGPHVYHGAPTTNLASEPRVVRAGQYIAQGTVAAPVNTFYTQGNPTTTYAPLGASYVNAPIRNYVGAVATVNSEMAKYDVENKGYITKQQLRVACKDLAVKCDTEEDLNSIWNEIDANGSGKINGIEFGEFYDYVRNFRDEVIQYQTQSQSQSGR